MSNDKKDQGSVSFPKKLMSLLPEGFADNAESMSPEDLKKKMVECERLTVATEKEMEVDPELAQAKQNVAQLAADYKETLKIERAKIKYLCYILDNRGV
jgi:hypothetical protein